MVTYVIGALVVLVTGFAGGFLVGSEGEHGEGDHYATYDGHHDHHGRHEKVGEEETDRPGDDAADPGDDSASPTPSQAPIPIPAPR